MNFICTVINSLFKIVLFFCLIFIASTNVLPDIIMAEVWDSSDYPYNTGAWPTLHHDVHNSDHMPLSIGSFTGFTDFAELAWVLKEEGHPSAVLTVEAVGTYADRDMLFITTGKTSNSNLHAYDMNDGSEIWHTALPTAEDEGPSACAMTSMVILNKSGQLFISDCKYLFRYTVTNTPDGNKVLSYDYKVPMPGLRQYNETDGLWYLTTDPDQPVTRAKPFITMFFTRTVSGKAYLGGVSTEGGVYIFDIENGSLYAKTYLESSTTANAIDWTPDGPCNVDDYVAKDNPMYYDMAEGAEDGLTPFGIWTTGVQPETNKPDSDYFMDPCQLSGYFNANTAGGGGMVINTPSVALDPDNPNGSRIFINGSQSKFLSEFDITPTTEDAIVYRIDFNPDAIFDKRLTIINYEKNIAGRFKYSGRMPNGENSLASPTLSHNEKWIITADNVGNLYNFSAETGQIVWVEEIGSLLGSPTVVQRTESDNLFYIHTFGDSKLWSIGCDPDSGKIIKKTVVDFEQYILRNHWRADDPGYGHHFVNQTGNSYERAVVGASIAVATDDKMVLGYTVGWHDPDRPAAFLIPTNALLLIVDRLSLMEDIAVSAMVDAAYIDKNGTTEQATLIAPSKNGTRAIIAYGSQSTSFARFMEVNNKMPEKMKKLYVKPYGGVRITKPIFTDTPILTPDVPSNQAAGTSIRWTASFPDATLKDYRFSVAVTGKNMQILKDFSPVRNFVWTPLENGSYTVRVTARNRETHKEISNVDVPFNIISPVPQNATVSVSQTNHPQVALFSHTACPAGARMRVDFRAQGDSKWASTGYVLSSIDNSANIYVAGLKGGITYEFKPVFIIQGVETYGETVLYTPADPGIEFPKMDVLLQTSEDSVENTIFMAGFPPSPSNPLPVATNISGDIVWYYNYFQDESVVATTPTYKGTVLLITADGDIRGQRLREVDLAGNIIREVTIDRINEQLDAMGQDKAGAFDHEAVLFPDGNTVVQLSVERLILGSQPINNILGSMIIALDQNWQVKWAWNSFDHMDINRPAINGDICIDTKTVSFPGCPPLFKSSKANDWIHGNHIAPSLSDGHLIYSMRNQSWIVKIDYAGGSGTGSVLWKLGTDGDFSAVSNDAYPWFSYQHGAAYISEHQIIVLDNGTIRCKDVAENCYSRGQVIKLNETEKTADFQLNSGLGVYSSALGNGQRLSNGDYNFTAGMLLDGSDQIGQVITIAKSGEKQFILETGMNIYRSFRMKNLYSPSLSGFTQCTALLSDDLSLSVPIIDIGGVFISANMIIDPTKEDLTFKLTDYKVLSDIHRWMACDTANLLFDGTDYYLNLPSISYGLEKYQVEMQLIFGDDETLWFKVTKVVNG